MNPDTHFFIGVDGGASKTNVRLENAQGDCLAQVRTGPANIRLSVADAWHAIHQALQEISQTTSFAFDHPNYEIHAGMGLAGCEMQAAREAFLKVPHPFKTLLIDSDAHTACLAAHQGKRGAILIIGTGVVGYQIEAEGNTKVGGWGFPYDDEGSGAWLGFKAVQLTLKWLDKRVSSELAPHILANFDYNHTQFLHWLSQANSSAYATLAPIIIEQSAAGNAEAIALLQQAADAIMQVSDTLERLQKETMPMPCTLVGGLSTFIQPYLAERLKIRLQPLEHSPEQGAILLVRHYLQQEHQYD